MPVCASEARLLAGPRRTTIESPLVSLYPKLRDANDRSEPKGNCELAHKRAFGPEPHRALQRSTQRVRYLSWGTTVWVSHAAHDSLLVVGDWRPGSESVDTTLFDTAWTTFCRTGGTGSCKRRRSSTSHLARCAVMRTPSSCG